ncbi:DNA cytosine methyltransferase [Paenibacillus rhizophilus]|uniref:DNA cytosine methyltransferase n=1 Tax=Paenibacillus rhizophilus TaxID=1850366 RepID=A0A3N9P2G6_9BACL|nr:DNA cytosine methyltransferase [Paenibacillus rhizophilus]RQW10403.1 DNA cytosine methyltransferase [Paenibacillus rhizophilus]
MKALDLYCCGGGAGRGLHQAGFEVTGVDINPQKRYPFKFIQSDVMQLSIDFLREFDFIWASPPCQAYTLAGTQWRREGKEYPDLIEATRAMLIESGVPWVIENVPEAPLKNPVVLCGAMFGLKTYRHRLFESSFKIEQPEHPPHVAKSTKMGRPPKEGEFMQIVGHFSGVPQAREIMGLPGLNQYELAQAIPPAYSKYIAEQFFKSISVFTEEPDGQLAMVVDWP